ncbi:MAG TPA: glycine cleavage system protein GcvH [Fimbriimonadales bacterium]|nr:glycine cleavage system protein GcvH [Fimbriimonadales bacterium]
MKIPQDLKYTKTHEWLRLEGDIATIGITDYAQSELGDIVYLDLPEPGRIVKAGEPIGTIESVKTVSDLYSPVSGEVVEVNTALETKSELVNTQPYEEGWIVKVRVEEVPSGLLSAEEYRALISE